MAEGRRGEVPFYPRAEVEAFLAESGKPLSMAEIEVSDGVCEVYVPILSKVVPEAKLHISRKPDGDFALQVGIFARRKGVVFCRWDRRKETWPHEDPETGALVTGPHKHYYALNVVGNQTIVARGEDHIPTTTLDVAVKAFCIELAIVPPERVVGSARQVRF